MSEIQPDIVHGDTQAQSYPVYALAYLLGIQLFPRIRSLKKLTFYRPDKNAKFKHIDTLFTETINWNLIEKHLPDMLRVILSIKAGKIYPSTILRRLGTKSRKNKLYFAFRELGRVVRTVFLLHYLADKELRQTIQAATCKSEAFNDFVQWVFFAEKGKIPSNQRHEQNKIIKYNHLVANLLILHNVNSMTEAIHSLRKEGYEISEEVLSALSPYRTQHVNRLGKYTIDPDRRADTFNSDLILV
jgi:TnpA family transposase